MDPVRAAQTPFGGPIAHGFLTLSMLSAMIYETPLELEGATLGLNYGFDKLRFIAPVPAGARIRGQFTPQKTDHPSSVNSVLARRSSSSSGFSLLF